VEAVVIGAGWAGLGVSYELSKRGVPHRVFERGRIGETWRNQRWDSFRLNTPNEDTLMPDERYTGSDPDGAMTHHEFIDHLKEYARRHKLPVEEGRAVAAVTSDGTGFAVELDCETVRTGNVVLATGGLCRPLPRPEWAAALPQLQIDGCDYRSAAKLPAGPVLIVGSGQTGAQIAHDLVGSGRRVYLATGRVGRLVRRYRGKDMLRWLEDSGFMDVRREEIIAAAGRLPARGVIGATRTLSLQFLSAEGVALTGRLTGLVDGRLTFADDLAEHMRLGDEGSANVKRFVDAYIEREGIEAVPAVDDPAETVAPRLPVPPIRALDANEPGSIIWCLGSTADYSCLKVAGALDAQGGPIHRDGVGVVPGLYFAGIDFGINRRSGTIRAVDGESALIAELVAQRR
jgi:putative flavoprotein involved in K+ transport